MKKLVSLVLVIYMLRFVPIVLNSCEERAESAIKELDEGGITYLLCGFDDAAENTDSMVLVNYSFASNEIHFVQIPRDTYFEYKGYSRINSIYPSLRSSGKSPHESMECLCSILEDALGVEIDAYAGYTTRAISDMIDDIGGVTLDLPRDFIVKSSDGSPILTLKAGLNRIYGDDAIKFLRSRNGYLMGDIGRLDAQKFFISALLREVKYNLGVSDILRLCTGSGEGWVISCKIGDFLKIALKNGGRISKVSSRYVTLPGSSVENDSGSWYYSVCASDCTELYAKIGMRFSGKFDPGEVMKSELHNFAAVYNGKGYGNKVYDDGSLSKIDVKMK